MDHSRDTIVHATMPPYNNNTYVKYAQNDPKSGEGNIILASDVTMDNTLDGGFMEMTPMVKSFLIVGVLFGLVVLLAIIHAYIEYLETHRKRRATPGMDRGPLLGFRRRSAFGDGPPKARTTRTHSILYVNRKNSRPV